MAAMVFSLSAPTKEEKSAPRWTFHFRTTSDVSRSRAGRQLMGEMPRVQPPRSASLPHDSLPPDWTTSKGRQRSHPGDQCGLSPALSLRKPAPGEPAGPSHSAQRHRKQSSAERPQSAQGRLGPSHPTRMDISGAYPPSSGQSAPSRPRNTSLPLPRMFASSVLPDPNALPDPQSFLPLPHPDAITHNELLRKLEATRAACLHLLRAERHPQLPVLLDALGLPRPAPLPRLAPIPVQTPPRTESQSLCAVQGLPFPAPPSLPHQRANRHPQDASTSTTTVPVTISPPQPNPSFKGKSVLRGSTRPEPLPIKHLTPGQSFLDTEDTDSPFAPSTPSRRSDSSFHHLEPGSALVPLVAGIGSGSISPAPTLLPITPKTGDSSLTACHGTPAYPPVLPTTTPATMHTTHHMPMTTTLAPVAQEAVPAKYALSPRASATAAAATRINAQDAQIYARFLARSRERLEQQDVRDAALARQDIYAASLA